MSFERATDFLTEYRKTHIKALNNEERMSWSTQPIDTLGYLFDEVFSTDAENTEWDGIKNPTSTGSAAAEAPDTLKLRAVQLKIAFLAGCYRDMRILFAAGEDNRQRLAVDQDRFEYMRLGMANVKMQILKQTVEKQADGLEGV